MASFGETLRRERELRGVELREIADATKISVRFLQALEQDRIEVLPGGVFRRAFVREYARYLGLDEERFVSEFLFSHGEPALPPPEKHPSTPYAAWLVLAIFLGAGVFFTLRSLPSRPAHEASTSVVPFPPHPSQDRVYSLPAVRSEPPEPDEQGLVLTLSARQSCWVAAQVDGLMVLNRVLNEGENYTLKATGEIVLSVGNAGGLSFRVNDRPGVPLGSAGEVRRNIVISKKSLPSLVEDAPSPSAPSS
jgi:cytoskeleton protein RodZ